MNKRFKSVDIIKGIAIIMIILVHYGQNFNFSFSKVFRYLQMGCPIFFIASGFSIMCLINNRYNGYLSKTNVKHFYWSRIKALAPGWYIAFAIIFCVNTVMLLIRGTTLSFGSNRDPLSIICNLLFLNGLLPFCNNNVMPGGWYIGTTVILYSLTPIIVKAINRAKNNRRLFFIVSTMVSMILWGILYIIFSESFRSHSFDYYFFLVHFPEYLLGIMLYYDLSEQLLVDKQIRRCLPWAFLTLILSIILFYVPIPFSSILSAWATALATYLFLYYMISNEQIKNNTEHHNLLEKFGTNSYCIYLLHAFFAWPFVQACIKICEKLGFPIIVPFVLLIPLSVGLSFIAGLILRKIIGKVNNLIFQG